MTTDEELQILCQKIYTLRVQNQLSQQEMAQKLRISLSALQKIEQGFPPLRYAFANTKRVSNKTERPFRALRRMPFTVRACIARKNLHNPTVMHNP